MPYIGNEPAANFQTPPAVVRFSGDGSDTTFDLGRTIGSVQEILVSVDGVIQEPSVAYAVSSGTTLTFTAAPSTNSGNNIFVYFLELAGESIAPAAENKGNFKHGGMFRTNAQSMTISTTITATENATATGTLGIASGVTLTIESGGRLVVL